MKYIIVDNINDNDEEISKFVRLTKELGIRNIRLDFDYSKYKYTDNVKVPDYYFNLYKNFSALSTGLGLNIEKSEQVEAILRKSEKI